MLMFVYVCVQVTASALEVPDFATTRKCSTCKAKTFNHYTNSPFTPPSFYLFILVSAVRVIFVKTKSFL